MMIKPVLEIHPCGASFALTRRIGQITDWNDVLSLITSWETYWNLWEIYNEGPCNAPFPAIIRFAPDCIVQLPDIHQMDDLVRFIKRKWKLAKERPNMMERWKEWWRSDGAMTTCQYCFDHSIEVKFYA